MKYTAVDVAEAMVDLVEARAEETKGREGYDGGSWGYHGYWLIARRKEAEAKFAERLEAVIDERVRLALSVPHLPDDPAREAT